MKYIALIYGEERPEMTEAEQQAEMQDYYAFNAKARARGVNLTGEALYPVATAKTVRVRDGKVLTTDGPFAETKEALGGYYVIDANTIEEACEVAAMIPGAKHGSVEVRPIVEF